MDKVRVKIITAPNKVYGINEGDEGYIDGYVHNGSYALAIVIVNSKIHAFFLSDIKIIK